MTESHRRGVTRAYVAGLVFAVAVIALAVLVAVWGALALYGGGGPVTTLNVPLFVAPVIVLCTLLLLAWGLWSQSLVLLRGKQTPSLAHAIAIAVGAYLVWCLAGVLVGLSLTETWLSWYALSLAVIWGLASLLCWAVLARRVYTDRPTPQWPWERRGEPGPDWANTDDDPWQDPPEDER